MAFPKTVEFLEVFLDKSCDKIDYVLGTSIPFYKECSSSSTVFESIKLPFSISIVVSSLVTLPSS